MKYLTPEIEALSKNIQGKSLARTNVSCGIFQDCNPSEERPSLFHQEKIVLNSLELGKLKLFNCLLCRIFGK
ncbi:hypothetical protein [uncultured Algibacter sp.]|uniref:hypothetical protein n=1 Tax=uncultured Algibacter sp. TaxID=298659 RepID=UPI002610EB96|nr:hypothetical protein [uncultured Algibacter sp.]